MAQILSSGSKQILNKNRNASTRENFADIYYLKAFITISHIPAPILDKNNNPLLLISSVLNPTYEATVLLFVYIEIHVVFCS